LVGNSEFWGGAFWLVLGAAVTWAGYDLDLGTLHAPGSGFLLFWLGLLMVGLSATVIGQALLRGAPTISSLWADTRWGKVLAVIIVLTAYAFFFEQIGFVAGAVAVALVLMLFIDPVRLTVAIPVTFLTVFGLWAALTKWLKIQLPAGVLAGWLS
jgi:putative tricarboxylic transport membrane protein